ncbi:hypothetical protein UH38_23965 [Aliterella atlantica CENA595]|uniref:Uncharacterized protein n=1 Tax=Aliterella atlantica CENA595 TaxID=1618023 RepID=A0A0D8ZQF2_9CYAN|nr:hypothetical protein UH38_23965 [Aliterella atlantica CENA595]
MMRAYQYWRNYRVLGEPEELINQNRHNHPSKPQNQPTSQQAWLEIIDKLKKDKTLSTNC